ncbi:MAG TPA: hypothetical protein VKI44_14480 [Acetobacteraceae bacterium]|nr:hypothetical protein [Acetobacteraceae bacterium]
MNPADLSQAQDLVAHLVDALAPSGGDQEPVPEPHDQMAADRALVAAHDRRLAVARGRIALNDACSFYAT